MASPAFWEDNRRAQELIRERTELSRSVSRLKELATRTEDLTVLLELAAETGVHRLVRISPFDASRRRQTSFASVAVVPEVDDVEVNLREDEVRVDVFRASGPGGQGVNTADSAVRITHLPTGIVVQCQNERSQLRNRDTAMRILKARLYELAQKKQREELDELTGEKKEIAFGSQIRSYTFHPYQLIKDHRTGLEVGNVEAVMDGDLDGLIRAYLLWTRGREA